MIAAWMLYCSLCALGLALAGVLAERLLLAGRAPVRLVWIASLVASFALPAIAFRVSSSPPVARPVPPTIVSLSDVGTTGVALSTPGPISASASIAPTQRDWRDTLPILDQPLLFAWAALSAAMMLSFGGGFLALAWMRRGWERRRVQGVDVFVSRRTGPAVVGAVAPSIVVPEWALALEASQLGLMLRHEQEHLRARDGQLLIAAQIALIIMPWNLALWWQVLSLRVAVEMDCDARVLRDADARSYGELLLEVARPNRGLNLAGMIAFAERATQLERRIRVLKRHRKSTSALKSVAAGGIALLTATAAWAAPHPATPHRIVASAPTRTLPVRVVDSVRTQPTALRRDVATATKKPFVSITTAATVRTDCTTDTTAVGLAYRTLFDGISLTHDNATKACAVLARLTDEQLAEDVVAEASAMSAVANRRAISSNRDAAIMAMLHSDADRATYKENSSRTPASAVILRSDNVVKGDTVVFSYLTRDTATAENRISAERMAVLKATAARGQVAPRREDAVAIAEVRTDTLAEATREARINNELRDITATRNEATYRRLFDGITLTPDEEATARKLIGAAQTASVAVPPGARPGTRLRVSSARGVAQIAAGEEAELLSLVSSDADRTKLRSRMIVVRQ